MSNRVIPGTGDIRRLVNPGSAASQAKNNPAPTIILLVGGLAAFQAFKAGQVPSIQSAGALAVGAIALVLVANFVPDLVTYSLLLMFLYVGLTGQPIIEDAIARVTSQIKF